MSEALTPKQEAIYRKVVQLINDYVPDITKGEKLTIDSNINQPGSVDSMGFILIVSKLEAAYNIRIPDRMINKLSTVRDVVLYIDKKTK